MSSSQFSQLHKLAMCLSCIRIYDSHDGHQFLRQSCFFTPGEANCYRNHYFWQLWWEWNEKHIQNKMSDDVMKLTDKDGERGRERDCSPIGRVLLHLKCFIAINIIWFSVPQIWKIKWAMKESIHDVDEIMWCKGSQHTSPVEKKKQQYKAAILFKIHACGAE